MLTEQLAKLFSSISTIECWDLEDSNCLEGVNNVISHANNVFYMFAISITVLFILLAALPKYTFKWSFLNDIILRRLIFLIGFLVSSYVLFSTWVAANYVCSLRDDSDVALPVFQQKVSLAYYISLALYPIIFIVVSVCLNAFLKRRKLFSIFRSNNKILGII